jgi:cobalt-zinc-cadmium efflux system membrane fusion protein
MKIRLYVIVLLGLLLTQPTFSEEIDHHGHSEEGHEEGVVTMTEAERQAQGIETARVEMQVLREEILVPGEVVINAYRSAKVTTRISAQIVARHARLDTEVKSGQKLITLSSVEMADAQGSLVVSDREWQRVKKLGRAVVSGSRYIEAQVTRQLAYAKVLAYGMTELQIDALLKQGDASKATGSFDLLSPLNGIIISDDFVVGEVVEPGRILFNITDESTLWVEAQLRPEQAVHIKPDSPVRVSIDGKHWLTGKVIQRHHKLDETTRTQSVRIEINNNDHLLHSGQFVDVALQTVTAEKVIAVPQESVVLMKGAPTVLKVEGDELHPQPVETGATRGRWTEIRSGLPVGEEIAVKRVFLLKSLLLKSRMGEGHVH